MDSVLAQFRDLEGNVTGCRLMIPQTSTPAQLDLLLSQQIADGEVHGKYTYLVNNREIRNGLAQDLRDSELWSDGKLRSEGIIDIVYCPQTPFRVKTITRATASMGGHTESILCVAFSPNGQYLVSGSGDSTIRFWDLNTETLITTGSVHKGWVQSILWSFDSKYVASGSMDNTVQIWDGKTGQPVGKLLTGHSRWITCLSWRIDNSITPVLASGSKDTTIRVWDPVMSRCMYTLSRHKLAVTCIRWGIEGHLYSGSRDGTICIWKDGRCLKLLTEHSHWVNSMSLSSDHLVRNGAPPGKEKLVTGSDDSTLVLWTCPFEKEPSRHRLVGHQGIVSQVVFSPDARWIISASFDKSIRLWSGVDGQLVETFRGHVGPVYQVSWSPDSRMVVSASKDATLKIWDIDQRKLLKNLPGHCDEVYAVDWCGDGSRIASGGKDRMLRMWRN